MIIFLFHRNTSKFLPSGCEDRNFVFGVYFKYRTRGIVNCNLATEEPRIMNPSVYVCPVGSKGVKIYCSWHWRGGLAVKNICCCCRGPEFSSQHPLLVAQHPRPPTSLVPLPASDLCGHPHACEHMYRYTHMYIIRYTYVHNLKSYRFYFSLLHFFFFFGSILGIKLRALNTLSTHSTKEPQPQLLYFLSPDQDTCVFSALKDLTLPVCLCVIASASRRHDNYFWIRMSRRECAAPVVALGPSDHCHPGR